MGRVITINMGEMAVGHNDTRVKTSGVGSCVAIVLYDQEARVGGMAHAMLPSRMKRAGEGIALVERAGIEVEAEAKYADESVDRLVKEIEHSGGKQGRLKAKLIGGARMFKILSGDKYGIGYQNVEAVRQRLEVLGIPIESEETGGTVGRIIELDLENGLVEVTTKM